MTKTKLLTVLGVLILSLFVASETHAAQCAVNECSSQGKYVCGTWGQVGQSGDMCCTGNGCPSWVCEKGGDLKWDGSKPQCCALEDVTLQCTCSNASCSNCSGYSKSCPSTTTSTPNVQCNDVWFNKTCTRQVTTCVPKWVEVKICPDFDNRCPYWVQSGQTCTTKNENYDCSYSEKECKTTGYTATTTTNCTNVVATLTLPKDVCTDATIKQGDTCSSCTGQVPGQPPQPPACNTTAWGPWSTCSAQCGGGTQSRVNECGTIETQACNPQACPPAQINVQGLIWNAEGKSCTANPSESDEIVRGSGANNIPSSSSISVTMDGVTQGTWDTSQNGYSYQFTNVTPGQHLITASVPDPVGQANSQWYLACVNGEESSVAYINAQSAPTTAHLGFRLATSGWFQVQNGDIYAGCTFENCTNSISMSLPMPSGTAGGFQPYLVSGQGMVLSNSLTSVLNTQNQESLTSDSNRYYAKATGANSQNISREISFDAPSRAIEISNCSGMFSGTLNPANVYKASRSCVQSGINSLSGEYNIASNGVAVVYVEADGENLAINKNIRSQSPDKRIILITAAGVEVAPGVGSAAPTASERAHIEMSIISESGITFIANDEGDDISVIVEGPLVSTKGAIDTRRDRRSQNTYPATVIKYNPLYLLPSEYKGASVIDVTWRLGY